MNIDQPYRVGHHGTKTWNAPPEMVFPFLFPVKEMDWIPDWEPKKVISNSGLMEENCLFIEPTTPHDAIWVVCCYVLNERLEMYRVAPGVTVSKFSIQLISLSHIDAETTQATLFYEHTSIGEEGDKVVREFTEDNFNVFMSHFEMAINHYLHTGQKTG
ncbi:hypothetical protein ACFL2V_01005 [Pseudomonadota bacterium]